MIVVPQLVMRSAQVALGEELPPVREARMLRGMGAPELSLLDLDGGLAADRFPAWVASFIAIAGAPVRFDGRLHDGAGLERASAAGFASVVVDQKAVFEPMLLRWALDVLGPRLVVEVQVDGEYVFDAPRAAFGRELVDVLGDLHLQGARRMLVRDVTGESVPAEQLQELADRLPGVRITYQGAVRSVDDVALLAAVGPAIEAVLVNADLVLGGSLDLERAIAAAGPVVDGDN